MTMPVGTEGAYWGSPELQDSIGEAVAEAEGSVETPTESPSGDEGAVESAHGSPSSSPRAEGTADDAGNDDQQSRGTPPDGEAEEGPEVQFEPFAYTVNGESRTLDGFHLVPGEGVYIPTDQVPRLQQIASRAEASEAALRELHQQAQA